MKMIRAGLYEASYTTPSGTPILYTVARNEGERSTGRWYITTTIGTEYNVGDQDYDTKSAAVEAIKEMGNQWTLHPQLGWCYTPTERKEQ